MFRLILMCSFVCICGFGIIHYLRFSRKIKNIIKRYSGCGEGKSQRDEKKTLPIAYGVECMAALQEIKGMDTSYEKIVEVYVNWINMVGNYILDYIPGEIRYILKMERGDKVDLFNAYRLLYGEKIFERDDLHESFEKIAADKIEQYILYKKVCWIKKAQEVGVVIDDLCLKIEDGKELRKSVDAVTSAFERDMTEELADLREKISKVIYVVIAEEINKVNNKKFKYGEKEYNMPKVKACRTDSFQYNRRVINELIKTCEDNVKEQVFSIVERIDLYEEALKYSFISRYKQIVEEEIFADNVKEADKRYLRDKMKAA